MTGDSSQRFCYPKAQPVCGLAADNFALSLIPDWRKHLAGYPGTLPTYSIFGRRGTNVFICTSATEAVHGG